MKLSNGSTIVINDKPGPEYEHWDIDFLVEVNGNKVFEATERTDAESFVEGFVLCCNLCNPVNEED